MDVTSSFLNDRSKLWTPSIEKLLRKWRKQICVRQKGHINEERTCLRKYQLVALPSIMMSSIVSTAIFSTFEDCPEGEVCNKKWIRLTSGILNMIGAMFLGINSLYNFQDKASKHKSSSDSYNELLRLIDSTLGTPTQFRGDAVAILQHIKSRYDDIIKQSESLSEEYTAELEYIIKRDGSETSSDKNNDYENSHEIIHRELSQKFKVSRQAQSPTENTRALRKSIEENSGDAVDDERSPRGDDSRDRVSVSRSPSRDGSPPRVPRVPSVTGLDKVRRDYVIHISGNAKPKDIPHLEVAHDDDSGSEVHLSFDIDEIPPATRASSFIFS
jgi:hypothetical protein